MFDKELFERYKPERQELNRLFYTEKNYELCLKCTKEFENHLKKNKITYRFLYQFTYMMLSKVNYRLRNITQSITYAKLAEKYSSNEDELNLVYWQLANCYFNINMNKVIFYYNMCEEYYKGKNDVFCLAQIMCNKASILKDDKLMIDSMKIYNKITNIDNYGYKDMNELNDENYSMLFDIYINGHYRDGYSKAWNLLHKIKDTNVRQKLSNLLLDNQMVG